MIYNIDDAKVFLNEYIKIEEYKIIGKIREIAADVKEIQKEIEEFQFHKMK